MAHIRVIWDRSIFQLLRKDRTKEGKGKKEKKIKGRAMWPYLQFHGTFSEMLQQQKLLNWKKPQAHTIELPLPLWNTAMHIHNVMPGHNSMRIDCSIPRTTQPNEFPQLPQLRRKSSSNMKSSSVQHASQPTELCRSHTQFSHTAGKSRDRYIMLCWLQPGPRFAVQKVKRIYKSDAAPG